MFRIDRILAVPINHRGNTVMLATCTDFNQLAKDIHADCVAAGWWADMNRPIRRTLMLVISELSEAMEGDRKNLMDDHLPHRKMLEVELADACIRMLDLGGRYGWIYESPTFTDETTLPKMYGNHQLQTCAVPEFLFETVAAAVELYYYSGQMVGDYDYAARDADYKYTDFLNHCLTLAQRESLDLFGAIAEKREYNRNRADHKPEARAQENGKKY